MTLGKKIQKARQKAGYTCETLAEAVDLSTSAIVKIENDRLKLGLKPELVNLFADLLNDNSIRFQYLGENPVYNEIIPRVFPELNNAKTDPSAILTKLEEEYIESTESTRILSRVFSHASPETATPNFREVLLSNLEQILDPLRGGEFLIISLIHLGILSEHDLKELHIRQQQKCIDNGHHKLQIAATG